MATQAEIDQARAAGARAASQAQAIADAAEPSLLDRIEQGAVSFTQGVDNAAVAFFHGTNAAAAGAADAAAGGAVSGASTTLNVLKWVGIVILVFVALLAFLWLAFAVFGFVWAGKLLRDIVPSLAPAAVAVARASR